MKIQFLWEEKKTTALFKNYLLQLFFSASCAVFLITFDPSITSNPVLLMGIPVVLLLSELVYLYLINKISSRILLLFFMFEIEILSSIFIVHTGSFHSIILFAPFVILIQTIFELGFQAAFLLAVFTVFNLIGIYIWDLLYSPYATLTFDFLFFTVVYVIVFVTEQTLGNQLSVQIEAQKKLERVDNIKNQFILISSHYLRTPLTIIQAVLSKLETGKQTDKILIDLEDVKNISKSTKELNNLVEKLLLISTIQTGTAIEKLTYCNIGELINNAIVKFEEAAKAKNIKVEFTSVKVSLTYLDANKIQQVIDSLLDNAIRYNKNGGSVLIQLSEDKKDIKITVTDTGKGIKSEYLDVLFSAFNKGTVENIMNFNFGTGLNLYLSRLIIEDHGGKISAESKENIGTKFNILLPIKTKNT